jgi:hypothetical protein
MKLKFLFRLLAVPLTALALLASVTGGTLAGGSEPPPGPSIQLDPPTLALDGQGNVVATTTLTCSGEAAESGHVYVSVSLGQRKAGGSAFVDTDCTYGSQPLTMSINSVTGTPFRPGPVSGIIEFEVVTETQAGQGIGEIDQLLLPPQASR